MIRHFALLAVAASIAAPAAVFAQPKGGAGLTYRCTGKDGKRYYGSTLPKQCMGQPIEQLNSRGLVVKRIDPEGDDKARAAKAAELAAKREREDTAKEESRRNRALLATYTSEKDIDEARRRSLAENQKTVGEIQRRIDGIRKDQLKYSKEMEFYTGKNKPPFKLSRDIKNAEIDLKAQEGLLAAKRKEVESINHKYDDDKKRYAELTGKKK